jgi:hypothetical protein
MEMNEAWQVQRYIGLKMHCRTDPHCKLNWCYSSSLKAKLRIIDAYMYKYYKYKQLVVDLHAIYRCHVHYSAMCPLQRHICDDLRTNF